VDKARAAGQRQADLEVSLASSTRAAVLEAGRLAMSYFGRAHGRWEKGPGQIVTDADLAVDGFLKTALSGLAPDAGWLSEETADDGSRLTARRVWVVDPIDGTRSFAEAKPEFTICVGLLEHARPVLGLVLNPATGELFEARAGQGATLNGAPIAARPQAALAGARIVVSRNENKRRDFERYFPDAQLDAIGSLALKLCLVACGRFDGYLSWRRAHDWDIAAAALILAEAGALLTDPRGLEVRFDTAEPVRRGLVAAAPGLHAAMIEATRAGFEAVAG